MIEEKDCDPPSKYDRLTTYPFSFKAILHGGKWRERILANRG